MKRAPPRTAGQLARRASRLGLPAPRSATSAARSGAPAKQLRGASLRAPAAGSALLRAQQQQRRSLAARKGRAPPARRKRWWFAALLLLALALLWLRPKPAPPLPKPPEIAAKQPAHRAVPNPPPPPTKPAAAVAPPKKPPAAAPADGISRELLLAAVQARSPTLRACTLPPGAPARVSARLRVGRAGDLRTVQFVNAEPLPRPLAECLRTTLQHWTFKDLPLKSDVEVLVDFLLGA
jgi:hypothetical protein